MPINALFAYLVGLGKPVKVKKGIFFHLPPYAEHGLENTGNAVMKVLIATFSPLRSGDLKRLVFEVK